MLCRNAFWSLSLVIACSSTSALFSDDAFSVIRDTDGATGNEEHRLIHNGSGHHFATVLFTPEKSLVFRPHPDRSDPDGWGMSVFVGPFIVGDGIDSGGLTKLDVTPTADGISIAAKGSVNATQPDVGTWSYSATITYDADVQRLTGTAEQTVNLNRNLEDLKDLNLFRLNSNFLYQVKLDDGRVGNTGDTTGVHWSYKKNLPGYTDQFVPTPAAAGTFPQRQSKTLTIFLPGNLNQAAGDGDESKRTPDYHITVVAVTPDTKMSLGVLWDANANEFDRDNLGVTPLVLSSRSKKLPRTVIFTHAFESSPPTAGQ